MFKLVFFVLEVIISLGLLVLVLLLGLMKVYELQVLWFYSVRV